MWSRPIVRQHNNTDPVFYLHSVADQPEVCPSCRGSHKPHAFFVTSHSSWRFPRPGPRPPCVFQAAAKTRLKSAFTLSDCKKYIYSLLMFFSISFYVLYFLSLNATKKTWISNTPLVEPSGPRLFFFFFFAISKVIDEPTLCWKSACCYCFVEWWSGVSPPRSFQKKPGLRVCDVFGNLHRSDVAPTRSYLSGSGLTGLCVCESVLKSPILVLYRSANSEAGFEKLQLRAALRDETLSRPF